MRLMRPVRRSVMGRIVLMARHRSHRLSAVDVTKEPDRCQRPSNGQQQRDEEQQNRIALHLALYIITPLHRGSSCNPMLEVSEPICAYRGRGVR
jgi:hypothetical protein